MDIIGILVCLIIGVICGNICVRISLKRGMNGGFWWGFFLWIIGIIIVALRPNDQAGMTAKDRQLLEKGGWICGNCGMVHASYDSFCVCGASRRDAATTQQRNAAVHNSYIAQPRNSEQPDFSQADEISKFKELLDRKIISQEEFEAKKRQLLDADPFQYPSKKEL